jgi:hypothetical protein
MIHIAYTKTTKGIISMGEIRTAAQRQRQKIQSGMIIGRLQKCVKGEIVMSPSQVNAARILLNKTLPDLKSLDVQASIEATFKPTHQLSDSELLAIASGSVVRLHPPALERPVIESTAVKVIPEPVPEAKVVNGSQVQDCGAVESEKPLPKVRPAPENDIGF